MEYIHTLPSDEWRAEVIDPMGNLAGTVNLDSIGVPHTWDAWGKNTSTTWDGMDALTWKGLQPETGTGLIYKRARWYDPTLGRFISEDPAGLAGGINPYVFADDDPINNGDPSGLFTEDPDLAQQLCALNGGTYGEFSDRSVCIAHTLPTVRITGAQDPLFGGLEPADPTPSVIFAQFANMSGPKQISTDPKAAWARCTEQAVWDNAASLGIDIVGAIIPEGSLLKRGAGIAGSANAFYHGDMGGIVAGPTSTTLEAFEVAEKNGSHIVKVPFLGNVVNIIATGNDIRQTMQSYRTCRR